MQTTPQPNLPRILCLHGSGSSAAIYQAQARQIIRTLQSEFEFVFIDGPFSSSAGPGMRPVYEDSGPFWRWHCDLTASNAFDISKEEILEEQERVRTQLWETLTNCETQQSGQKPFVGVMGFSQGARLATGLLLHAAKQNREKGGGSFDLKFAIINSVTYPFLSLDNSTSEEVQKVDIPTIHLHGSMDPWRRESEKTQVEYFAPDTSTVIEYAGGHQVPVRSQDVVKIANALRRIATEMLTVQR